MAGVLEATTAVTPPDWWWPGWLIGLGIFFLAICLLCWLLLRWGQRQVDKLDADIIRMNETQRLIQQDMRRKLWNDMEVEDE